MPLNVSYKNRIGYYTHTKTYNGETKTYRIYICHANALWAEMYFYTDNNGEKMVQLHSFLADYAHFKNTLKEFDLIWGDNDDFVFNPNEMEIPQWNVARELAKRGKKVRFTTEDKSLNETKE